MAEKRNFALRDEKGNEIGVFSGRQPRQAALKAANRHGGTKENPVIIKLRERGTKKVHVFSAWRELISYLHPFYLEGIGKSVLHALCRSREHTGRLLRTRSFLLCGGTPNFP